MDSSAVAYDTADISESARDAGLSWPAGSGALNAEGGMGVASVGLRVSVLAGGDILEAGGAGSAAAAAAEALASGCGFGGELSTGGDEGVGSGSGLGSETGSTTSVVSAAGAVASCKLSLDDESLRECCCCTSTGLSLVSGKPARGEDEDLAALGLALGRREVDPVPW